MAFENLILAGIDIYKKLIKNTQNNALCYYAKVINC